MAAETDWQGRTIFKVPRRSVLARRLTDIDKSDICVRDVYPWILTHCGDPKVDMGLTNIIDQAHLLYYASAVRRGMNPLAACRAACALVPMIAEAICDEPGITQSALSLLPAYRGNI